MDDTTAPAGLPATEAIDLFIDAVVQTPAELLDRPSNLGDWSLRDLVGHATGSAAKVIALIEGSEVSTAPSQPADWADPDPVPRLRALAARLREVLPGADLDALRTSPHGEVPLRRALAFPVADLALHSWDVHRAQGRRLELPEELLAYCRALVDSVPQAALRRPGAFGPAQPAPAGATPTEQLLAFLGRSVG